MKKYVMSLNCGSSSAKFTLFMVETGNTLLPLISGIVEEIGNTEKSVLRYFFDGEKHRIKLTAHTHQDALITIFDKLSELGVDRGKICAVGHRIVQGGELFNSSVVVNQEVLDGIKQLIPLAPLHNPHHLNGIVTTMKLLPNLPQVAVFDNAFHATIPEYAFRYGVPDEWYRDYKVRRYGFHGTSHLYVSRRAARLLRISSNKFHGITVHLGNGCSITKIRNGKSADTSMGLTPLEGLIMGTRSGDLDPAIISHVADRLREEKGLDEAEAYRRVLRALNKKSGLVALGGTNLMQEIRAKAEAGEEYAQLIIDMYAYRTAKYIGSYWTTLPEVHAVVFTAGVGENEGYVRKRILGFLENLKFEVDEGNNSIRGEEVIIAGSKVEKGEGTKVMVIPTNEEVVIGYDALFLGYLSQPVPEVYPFEN